MTSASGSTMSVHSTSSRLVVVTKFAAKKTPTTPSTLKSLAARGETSAPTGSFELALPAPAGEPRSKSAEGLPEELGLQILDMENEVSRAQRRLPLPPPVVAP